MTANHLEANLKRIALRDKALADLLEAAYSPDYPEIRASKDGSPIPVVARKSLHSTYDPIGEARKWVESLNLKTDQQERYVLGGVGFAYHLQELLKTISADRIVVVEKDAALLAAALAYRPPETFPEGLRFIVGEDPVSAYQKLCDLRSSDTEEGVFLPHPASTHVYPDYYLTIGGMLRARKIASRGGFKILLVSPLYGGSLPVVGYVQRALTALGHRCEVLDNSVFYPGMKHLLELTSNRNHMAQLEAGMTTLLAESVTARALEIRADLILGIAQSPITTEVLKELKNADIKTAFWFVEDGATLPYWKAVAPYYDQFFVIQKGDFLSQLKEVGCSNPYYLPLAADPKVHRPVELTAEEREEFGSDLSHVGAGYHNRREFFAGLLDFNLKIWGSDWEDAAALSHVIQRNGERVSTEEAVKIFNATRLNVNLHSSTFHSGVNPFGDFLNPRTYEIASCGAFQLVDERQYMAENFVIDGEIVTFSSLQEMRDKAREYLDKPEKCREIAGAARRRVIAQHTYEHRMLELLGVIAGRDPEWKPSSGGLPTAEEIIREAGSDSELAEVMQRFVGKGPLTLEGVAEEIERGKGELSRTEAMILLLNEFRRWGIEKGVM